MGQWDKRNMEQWDKRNGPVGQTYWDSGTNVVGQWDKRNGSVGQWDRRSGTVGQTSIYSGTVGQNVTTSTRDSFLCEEAAYNQASGGVSFIASLGEKILAR